ncbi:MAG: hypothetical protein JNL30_18430 [Rubrivivax sp.]|nr:hypothetical protein [Rubrivivax sp.]
MGCLPGEAAPRERGSRAGRLFASICIVDRNFVAKPALALWDSLFARRPV